MRESLEDSAAQGRHVNAAHHDRGLRGDPLHLLGESVGVQEARCHACETHHVGPEGQHSGHDFVRAPASDRTAAVVHLDLMPVLDEIRRDREDPDGRHTDGGSGMVLHSLNPVGSKRVDQTPRSVYLTTRGHQSVQALCRATARVTIRGTEDRPDVSRRRLGQDRYRVCAISRFRKGREMTGKQDACRAVVHVVFHCLASLPTCAASWCSICTLAW